MWCVLLRLVFVGVLFVLGYYFVEGVWLVYVGDISLYWFLARVVVFVVAVYLLVVRRWPRLILSEKGDSWLGVAGAWGLRAKCVCTSKPSRIPSSPPHDIVAVSFMGYEAKICTYDFFLFSPGQRDMFDPVIVGDLCEPVFAVAPKSIPVEANMAAEKAYKRGDFITGTVVWSGDHGAAFYPLGDRIIQVPVPQELYKDVEPPVSGPYGEAETIASILVSQARPRPSTFGYVRLGIDEFGCTAMLPDHHVGVWGATGSGKTTLLMNLALKLTEKGRRVWIIDFFGECTPLSQHGFDLVKAVPDPLQSLPPEEAVAVLDATVRLVFNEGLTPIQYASLLATLRKAKTVDELVELLQKEGSRRDLPLDERNAYLAVYRRLLPMSLVEWADRPLAQGKLVVYDLSGYDDVSKVVAANLVLRKALEQGRTTVIIDEIHRLARKTERGEHVMSVLMEAVRESRALGVRLIVADQHLAEIPAAIVDQLANIYLRYPKPPRGVRPEIAEKLPKLSPGEALLQYISLYTITLDKPKITPTTKHVVKIRENETNVRNIAKTVTIEELEAYMRGTADEETVKKLRKLGLVRGSKRLTSLGRQVYQHLLREKQDENRFIAKKR